MQKMRKFKFKMVVLVVVLFLWILWVEEEHGVEVPVPDMPHQGANQPVPC